LLADLGKGSNPPAQEDVPLLRGVPETGLEAAQEDVPVGPMKRAKMKPATAPIFLSSAAVSCPYINILEIMLRTAQKEKKSISSDGLLL
jgi:hypothetical protein